MENECDNLPDKERRAVRDGDRGRRRWGGGGPHTVENSWENVAIKQLFKTCPLLTSLKVLRRLYAANAQSKYSLCRRYGNFTPRTHTHPSVSCFCMPKKKNKTEEERERESSKLRGQSVTTQKRRLCLPSV